MKSSKLGRFKQYLVVCAALALLLVAALAAAPDSVDATANPSVAASPGPASAGGLGTKRSPKLIDITSTAKGRQATSEFTARSASHGNSVGGLGLKVYAVDGNTDDLVIASDATSFKEISSVRNPDGSHTLNAAVVTGASKTSNAGNQPQVVTDAPYWSLAAYYCFGRSTSNYGYFDTCYYVDQLINDGNSGSDYFAIHHRGTAGPTGSSGWITEAWLESGQDSSSSTMTWMGWSPGGDVSGNCTPGYTYGISVYGVSWSSSVNRCETWDITKFSDAGHFKNKWSGSVAADREVAYMTAVAVPQGGWPVWWLNFSHTSCFYFCDTAP